MSSSESIEQEQTGIQTSPSFEFWRQVGLVTGGTLLSINMLAISVMAGGLLGLAIAFHNLPQLKQIRNFSPAETTYIYDIKGKLLAGIHVGCG